MTVEVSGPSLPAHDHVRFDDLASPLQVRAGLVHVKADGVYLVAGGLGQTVAGSRARVGRFGDAQSRFRDYPGVARAFRKSNHAVTRIGLVDDRGSSVFVARP